MRRRLNLQPLSRGEALNFEWNPQTGELAGRDADRVRALAREAVAIGFTQLHPAPATYTITDPLRDPVQLAALLGWLWRLPDDLQRLYPHPEPAPETVTDDEVPLRPVW